MINFMLKENHKHTIDLALKPKGEGITYIFQLPDLAMETCDLII